MADIEIYDESTWDADKYVLSVDGNRKACVTRNKAGVVQVHWEVYGPQYFEEAQKVLQGLMELFVWAGQLNVEKKNVSSSSSKRR